MTERLQKVLAHAGVSSRRSAERLIVEGRVTVNGSIVTELGTRVDPDHDAIKVDGKRIAAPPKAHTYLALNKPRGVVTTLSDPEGRPTVKEYLRGVKARVYPVGRLDYNTEGLLILTDDGGLARDLMHPSRGVEKTYLAKVKGQPDADVLLRLSRGIPLDGRRTGPARVRMVRRADNAWIEITIGEGRNRQVRRMFQAIGHPVQRLRRMGYGGIGLGRLPVGQVRVLSEAEVGELARAAGRVETKPRRGRAQSS
jgi:23S rRNA pseudouridine2605 synthase